MQSANKVKLVGDESLAGLVDRTTPPTKVGLAPIHENETERQSEIDADDLQHQSDLLKVFAIRDVRRKPFQFLAGLAGDLHAGRHALNLPGAACGSLG